MSEQLDWRALLDQLRTQRHDLLTKHRNWWSCDKEIVEELFQEVWEWKRVLQVAVAKAPWQDRPEAVNGEGMEQDPDQGLDQGAQPSTSSGRHHEGPSDRPSCSSSRAPGFLDLLASLSHHAPDLLASVIQGLPKKTRRALRAASRAGRDAVRASTTSITLQGRDPTNHHGLCALNKIALPMNDLSVTHPRLHTLCIELDGERSVFLRDLMVRCPQVFRHLRSLVIRFLGNCSSFMQVSQLQCVKQLVCMCDRLFTLVFAADHSEFTLQAPSSCSSKRLDSLHMMFEGDHSVGSFIKTPLAKRCLTAMTANVEDVQKVSEHLADAVQLTSLCFTSRGFMTPQVEPSLLHQWCDCQQLQELRLSCLRLKEFPSCLLALQQLKSLELHLVGDLKISESFHVMSGLLHLQSLEVVLEVRDLPQHPLDPFAFPGDAGGDALLWEQASTGSATTERQVMMPVLQSLCLRSLVPRSGLSRALTMVACDLLGCICAPLLKQLVLHDITVSAPVLLQLVERSAGLLVPSALQFETKRERVRRFRDTQSCLIATSEQLRHIALRRPQLLQHSIMLLDNDLDLHAVVAAVQAAGSQLQSLKLSHQRFALDIHSLDDSVLTAVTEFCPGLKQLELRTSSEFTSAAVVALVAGLSNLQHLVLTGQRQQLGDECIVCIATSLPDLQHLELSGVSQLSEAAVESLCRNKPSTPINNMATMRRLRLLGCNIPIHVQCALVQAGWGPDIF